MAHKSEMLENLLVRIVTNYELSEQSQIQEKLRENGVELPQSTISRWLKKLNIVKINNRYQIVNPDALVRVPVLGIKFSLPNLIILHTLPGNANSLASQIDQRTSLSQIDPAQPFFGVLGTIAGDDTVLIIMENEKVLLALKEKLEDCMHNFSLLFE